MWNINIYEFNKDIIVQITIVYFLMDNYSITLSFLCIMELNMLTISIFLRTSKIFNSKSILFKLTILCTW